jgi:hypothetical protein
LKPEGKSPRVSWPPALGLGWPGASASITASRQKNGQTVENQRPALDEAIDRRASGSDQRISGANGRDKCPAFDRLLNAVGSDVCTTPGSDVGRHLTEPIPTGYCERQVWGMSRHPGSMIARVRLRWLEEVSQMSAIGT